jgi:hypothetical protein
VGDFVRFRRSLRQVFTFLIRPFDVNIHASLLFRTGKLSKGGLCCIESKRVASGAPMADAPIYVVSHIVEEKWLNPNKREFKIRWLGYSSDDDTWEPMENLEDGASHVIREWDRRKKTLAKRKTKEGDAYSLQPKRERASKATLRQQSMDSFVQKPHMVQASTPSVKVVLFLNMEHYLILGED